MKNIPTLTVVKDHTKKFQEIMKQFKNDVVLVGIPQSTSKRDAEIGVKEPINNATILAINHFGSEANNIPARPVLSIGIRNAQPAIAEEFKKAAKNVFKEGIQAIDKYYERAGMIAANSVKKAINDQEGFPGPADSTLRAREARGFKGTKSLIITGQLRNAITYVVRKEKY